MNPESKKTQKLGRLVEVMYGLGDAPHDCSGEVKQEIIKEGYTPSAPRVGGGDRVDAEALQVRRLAGVCIAMDVEAVNFLATPGFSGAEVATLE